MEVGKGTQFLRRRVYAYIVPLEGSNKKTKKAEAQKTVPAGNSSKLS